MDVQNKLRVKEIAQEILDQLKDTFNINVLWSWGMEETQSMTYRNMPSLGFRVNGFKHKGWVIVSLNEGKDLYNIYLLDKLQQLTKVIEDVYCEDLEILDSLIETGETTEEEYAAQVNNEYVQNPLFKLINSMI